MWNVRGLKYKWTEDDFISFIKQFDIIILVETWATQSGDYILDGYNCYENVRQKTHRRGRPSGGISCFVRQEFTEHIQHLNSEVDDLIWLKLNMSEQPIILGSAYITPHGASQYANDDKFLQIENDMIKFCNEYIGCKFMLMGDFNARTGDLLDCICQDGAYYIPVDSNIYDANYIDINRNNCDSESNVYGKQLVDLCKSASLCIVNGRTVGDRDGQFTCMTETGQSVVDYLLISQSLFSQIIDFKVGNQIISDHFPLEFTVNHNVEVNVIEKPRFQGNMFKKYRANLTKFEAEFHRVETQSIVSDFLDSVNSELHINNAVTKFNELFYRIAKPLSVQHECKSNAQAQSKWYDLECSHASRNVQRKLNVFRNSRNQRNFLAYKQVKASYKNLIRKKKCSQVARDVAKIKASLDKKDPSLFWAFF